MNTVFNLDTLVLQQGSHGTREAGVCLLEAVAYVAGEPHTDHPACVSPVLGAFGRAWNGALDDEWRQKLKPFIPRMIGTAGDGHDETRAWLATDWLVRVHAPAWLRLIGRHDLADALERSAPILSAQAALDAQPLLDRARRESAAARAAAWATAIDAATADASDTATDAASDAGYAARDAAWAAALAAADTATDAAYAARDAESDTAIDAALAASVAARVAASVAASDTAIDAAWATAIDAALAAASDTAIDAATKALAPTRDALKESAMDLFERLIALGEESRRAAVGLVRD